MQLTLLFLVIILNLNSSDSQTFQTARLTVTITNIPSDKGSVRLNIFASKDDFPYKSYRFVVKPAKAGALEFVLENLPMQEYAIMAHHDENDNEDLDSNFFSLPTEYYGFSNDARSVFGPPSFKSSKFMLDRQHMRISFKVQ